MPVTQILSVVGRGATGGGGGGGGTPVAADIYFNSDNMPNAWTGYGTTLSGQYNSVIQTDESYTYPDSSTGKVYLFTGNEFLYSPNLGNVNAWTQNLGTITVDMWFYPTANGIQILSESDRQDVSTGYHYTVLEINSTGNVLARFWNGSAATSDNTVTLNQWNHVYWAENWVGGHYFDVNGVTTNTGLNYNRVGPGYTSEFFSIGAYDSTNMGNSGRFQGKVGKLNIHDSLVGSTFTATKAKYGL